ncbi:TPA: acetyl-CoA carboxylase biotin carboxylase subunit [Candidatus Bipolaricaulota bacterium]|nr:acetyl-CoA carboxylase biotin carboxylase subunit [Candidatus Bipolaricaulota bacterium]
MRFKKVLVANRGEIAIRIIEACHELGIKAVAVYSEADRDSLHVRLADEALCIGPAEATRSYLSLAAVFSAAEISGAEAIHPGYGFLSENPEMPEICEELGIKFIGPAKEIMEKAGDKLAARQEAQALGIPVLPGSGPLSTLEEAEREAQELGYPLMLKATGGGGGKGMRIINDKEELWEKFHPAKQEVERAFADPRLYLERYIPEGRHIEVQILADSFGEVVHWGERDCSIQRRYQKLIEEAPAPGLSEDLRERIREAAVRLARALRYENAGTMEFLLDAEGRFYFIELNARIQVEHPISELLTGRNLIKEQIRIAAGEPLGYSQSELSLSGHAIECRINAEDVGKGFTPSLGRLKIKGLPGGHGVRLDTHIYEGMEVGPWYDPLLAKLITWGQTREEARLRMIGALERFEVEGVKTTRNLCREIITSPPFAKGECTTAFLASIAAPAPEVEA